MKVNLKLEGCNLEITGTYSKAEPDVGLQASFEIEKIHDTVWVFKNALKENKEVIEYNINM